jgi:cobalt-zinc-cadmium resistance protein CzcA
VIFLSIDSLYTNLLTNAELKNIKGDFSNLDLLLIKDKQQQSRLEVNSTKHNIDKLFQKLRTLMNSNEPFVIPNEIEVLSSDDFNLDSNPFIQLLKLHDQSSEDLLKIEKNRMLPDISLNYFIGTNYLDDAKIYNGFQAGLAVPLLFKGDHARVKSAKIAVEAQKMFSQNEIQLLSTKLSGFKTNELEYKERLDYYNTSGKKLHDEILRATLKSYQGGNIDLFKFVYSYGNAMQIRLNYLDNVLDYNKLLLEQMYLSN